MHSFARFCACLPARLPPSSSFFAFAIATLATKRYLLFRVGFEYTIGAVYSMAAVAMLRLLTMVHVSLLKPVSIADTLQPGRRGSGSRGAKGRGAALVPDQEMQAQSIADFVDSQRLRQVQRRVRFV